MSRPRVVSYSSGFRWLHWGIAAVVILLLSLSFFLDALQDSIKPSAVLIHKSLGLTILGLMVVRLFWVFRTGRLPLPTTMPQWEVVLARVVQAMMYVVLFAMPLVGWVMSLLSNHVPSFFGLFYLPIPGIAPNPALAKIFFQAHQSLAWVLIILITLHVAGALKHAIIDKDNVMERMLP